MILWCSLLQAKTPQSSVAVSKKNDPISALVYANGYIFCTAFVITDSLAITAGHCLATRECITTQLKKGCSVPSQERMFLVGIETQEVFEVKIRTYELSTLIDFAVIEGDFRNFNKVKINLKDFSLKENDKLKHCGFARGTAPYVCTYGKYVGMGWFSGKSSVLIIPGMSGGPVFDKDNVVVGINTSGYDEFSLFTPVIGIVPYK